MPNAVFCILYSPARSWSTGAWLLKPRRRLTLA